MPSIPHEAPTAGTGSLKAALDHEHTIHSKTLLIELGPRSGDRGRQIARDLASIRAPGLPPVCRLREWVGSSTSDNHGVAIAGEGKGKCRRAADAPPATGDYCNLEG